MGAVAASDMNENTDFVLVKRTSSALEKVAPGAKRVLSGMVADALALAKREQSALNPSKFRIGDYDWCEPDYRQIHVWAKAIGIPPEQIIDILKKDTPDTCWAKPAPAFYEGRLLRLSWDLMKLPLKKFEWVEGLRITHFSLKTLLGVSDEQRVLNDLNLVLPHLTHLGCYGSQGFNRAQGLNPAADAWSRILNLLSTPELKELACIGCGLSDLELSSSKKLQSLTCPFNRLSQLDLSPVPDLTFLECGHNHLSQLDLSVVPSLTVLDCADNGLAELDISNVSRLTFLNCEKNELTHLPFPTMSELNFLDCSKNSLSNLELSSIQNLTSLYCSENKIAQLDLNMTPRLETLSCDSNYIRILDIRSLKFLKDFYYDRGKVHLIQRPDQNF
jgi:Leucine-rich repeat (LRR) protein